MENLIHLVQSQNQTILREKQGHSKAKVEKKKKEREKESKMDENSTKKIDLTFI